MTDPRRIALAKQLFGLTTGGGDAQKAMALRIGAVVLSDIIGYAQEGWRDCGPGVLVFRQQLEDAIWADEQHLRAQLAIAEEHCDEGMIRCLTSALARIDTLNIEKQAPVAIADHRGFRLLLLPVDDPSSQLETLMTAAQGG